MTFLQCNACGGIYAVVQDDGTTYQHVCPDGTKNARNENPPTGMVYYQGKAGTFQPVPGDPTQRVFTAVQAPRLSDGAGASPCAAPAPMVEREPVADLTADTGK
jgi:hypothetical protein